MLASAALATALVTGAGIVLTRTMPDMTTTAAIGGLAGTDGEKLVAARNMPNCGGSARVTCIVDGDTLWLDGTKIRIANIDAPEIDARCTREKQLALDAKAKLRSLLSGRAFTVRASGKDRYGRTLATLSTDRGDVGEALVGSQLAVSWAGKKADAADWCAA